MKVVKNPINGGEVLTIEERYSWRRWWRVAVVVWAVGGMLIAAAVMAAG